MATISLSFPDELKAELQAKADKEERSLSKVICMILKESLKKQTVKKKPVRRKK